MKIKAYTGYSDSHRIHYYTDFEIVDKLPELGEVVYGDEDNCIHVNYGERERVCSIQKIELDCEQGNDEVYDYDYYKVETQFEEYDEQSGKYDIIDVKYGVYYKAVKRG